MFSFTKWQQQAKLFRIRKMFSKDVYYCFSSTSGNSNKMNENKYSVYFVLYFLNSCLLLLLHRPLTFNFDVLRNQMRWRNIFKCSFLILFFRCFLSFVWIFIYFYCYFFHKAQMYSLVLYLSVAVLFWQRIPRVY